MANQNTQLTAIDQTVEVGHYNDSQLATLKQTIAKGTTDHQFALFVQTCIRTGLDPFLNQIYCIVYNSQKDGPTMSMQIAVEGIVALAKKNPEYGGFIASEIRQNDDFKISMQSGEVEHNPNIVDPGPTIAAYCVAYRDGKPPVSVIVRKDQVEHLIKGRNGTMWKDYLDDMIVKHAMKRAFKRQFGIEVADTEDIQPPQTNVSATEDYRERKEVNADESNVIEAEVITEEAAHSEDDLLQEQRKLAAEGFQSLGITDKKEQQEFIQKNVNPKGQKPTLAEMKKLNRVIKVEIDLRKSVEEFDLPD